MSNACDKLRSDIDRNKSRSHWAAWLIIIGLAMEAAFALNFPAGRSIIENWSPVITNALIALGVYGEIHFSGKASRAQKALQSLSDERVAESESRAAEANQKTAELQIALEKERQRRLGRTITKDQFDIFQTLRGKVSKVYVICDRDPEALYFSGQITTALKHAGIELVMLPARTGDVGTGLLIMLGSAWPGKATEHPLVDAFLRAGLYGGVVNFNEGPPALPPGGPLLLIGQKMVELENPYFPLPHHVSKDTELY